MGVPSDTFPRSDHKSHWSRSKTPTELLSALPICVVRVLFAALRVPPPNDRRRGAAIATLKPTVTDSEGRPAFIVTTPAGVRE